MDDDWELQSEDEDAFHGPDGFVEGDYLDDIPSGDPTPTCESYPSSYLRRY